MGDPIINAQVDAINATLGNIKVDLAALRPSIRAIRDAIAETYITDTIENVPIASFNDGADEIPVRELQVAINPIQSLNGQTSPYPAGGGKNMSPLKDATTTGGGNLSLTQNGKYGENYVANTTYTFSFTALESNAAQVQLRYNNVSVHAWNAGLFVVGNRYSWTFTPTADGYINLWSANAAFTGSKKVFDDIQVEAGSTPTPYAPYSNICPISGHTEVNVVRTGKNLFDKDAVSVGVYLSTTTGLEEPAASYVTTDYIPVQANKVVYIPSSGTTRRWLYDRNKTPKTFINYSGAQAYTPTEDGYIRVSIRVAGSPTIDLTSYQIEYGSTATAYEPYTGQTYNVPLGQTVYGGTLNVTTGVLTIDRAMVDLGTLTWAKQDTTTSYRFRAANVSIGAKQPPDNNTVANIISSAYKAITATQTWNTTVGFGIAISGSGSTDVLVFDTAYSDAAAFKTAMNGVQLVYELATPATVQLTQTEIETLFGQNNVWADTNGNIVKLTYRKAWEIALAQGE